MGWIRKSGSSSMGAQSLSRKKSTSVVNCEKKKKKKRESAEFLKDQRDLWRLRAGLGGSDRAMTEIERSTVR